MALKAMPGTQMNAGNSPYMLPNTGQYFDTASLVFQNFISGVVVNAQPNPPYMYFTALDSTGTPIYNSGKYFLWQSLGGTQQFTFGLFGGKFWKGHVGQNVNTVIGGTGQVNRVIAANMPICGWKIDLTLNGATSVNFFNPLVGVATGFH
jgi:hypothetical protein